MFAFNYLATKHMRHDLMAVADTKYRNIELKDSLIRPGTTLLQYRCGPPRENDARRIVFLYLGGRSVKRQNLGFYAEIPHASCYQVSELAPEIKDDDHSKSYH